MLYIPLFPARPWQVEHGGGPRNAAVRSAVHRGVDGWNLRVALLPGSWGPHTAMARFPRLLACPSFSVYACPCFVSFPFSFPLVIVKMCRELSVRVHAGITCRYSYSCVYDLLPVQQEQDGGGLK